MGLPYRLRGAAVKIEGTYATDSVPTAANDAVLCQSIEVTPIDLATVDVEQIRHYFGAFRQLVGAQFGRVQLVVPLAGFGTAGPTTPTSSIDALRRICGHSRTVVAATSVTYAPASTTLSSASVYVWQSGLLHRFTGCFGDYSIGMSEDGVPTETFDLIGIYQPVIDQAVPTFTTSAFITPVLCNAQNTAAVSIRGFAAEITSFNFATGNVIERTARMGSTRQLNLRNRVATGSISLAAPTVAMKDFWADVIAASTGPMSIAHGTTVGNRFQFASVGGLQLGNPRFSEGQGELLLSFDCRFVPTTAGNDEYAITIT